MNALFYRKNLSNKIIVDHIHKNKKMQFFLNFSRISKSFMIFFFFFLFSFLRVIMHILNVTNIVVNSDEYKD